MAFAEVLRLLRICSFKDTLFIVGKKPESSILLLSVLYDTEYLRVLHYYSKEYEKKPSNRSLWDFSNVEE